MCCVCECYKRGIVVIGVKDDGQYGFKSDYLINGTDKLFTVLSIMFNVMLTHGFNPDDLLRSTIISIPKDSRGSLCSSDNYRGISLSNSICKLVDYVFIHMHKDSLQTCDLDLSQIIRLYYVLQFI